MLSKVAKSTNLFFISFGIDLKKFFYSMVAIPSFIRDYISLRRQKNKISDFSIGSLNFQLADKYDTSGIAKGHYFHQDLLVASKIFINNPKRHIDVGSRVDGFVAHVASFRKIDIIDIRVLNSINSNINYLQADLMSELPGMLIESCDSLSCLHALEHFGLGRYGDRIHWEGHLLGFENLFKILKQGGRFYFSVPIGRQRIEFNAHRVFSLTYLVNMFRNRLEILSFAYVDDLGDLHTDIILDMDRISNNCGCYFGCGIFELKKL